MELAVLGTLACLTDDGRQIVPQRRDRALLAVLAIDRHRVWSVDELADAIWHGEPSDTAVKLVRNRVSHLRRTIGPALIVSVASGYRLGESVALDIDDLSPGCAPMHRRGTGRPFVDIEDWDPAWPAIAHATELLRAADEAAVAGALRSGAPDDLAARAEALVAEQPLRERRWVLLVRALHAAGRRRDALEAVARARRAFVEVGLTSPIELDAEERDILTSLAATSEAARERRRDARPPLPALVGRADDVRRIALMLAPGSLVSLTGPGGVGKTALALEAADGVADRFADGVWVCDLAAVTHGDDVTTAVATTMRLRPDGGVATPATLAAALRLQHSLIVLDNCEHVIDAVAVLVSELVRIASTAVLVTSRESIGVTAEHVHVVRPLDADDAVALFLRRRRSAGGLPVGDDAGQALVRDICVRLDGLPLAVELAATRSVTISLTDLLERLDERFRLLRSDHAPVVRHRSLEATVGWSYSLLTDRERVVFDRLSVLLGPFALSTAEAICTDDVVTGADVVEAVLSLAAKSMVATDGSGRYRLLETLRHYGVQQLHAKALHLERAQVHAAHYASFAEHAHRGLRGPDAARWYMALDAEWANLREAFAWSLDHDRLDLAAVLATRTLWVALFHDRAEPYAWVAALSTRSDLAGHPDWPGVLAGAAWAAFERGEATQAQELAESAIAAEPTARPNIDGFAELTLQSVAYLQGRIDDAVHWVERAEARARAENDPVLEASTGAVGRAILALARGDAAGAIRHAQFAGRLARTVGNPTVTAWALAWEAEARQAAGDEGALAAAQQAAALAESVGSWLPRSSADRVAAQHYIATGRTADAARIVHSCLRATRRRGSLLFISMYLGLAVPVLIAAGADDSATRLLGAFLETPTARYPNVQLMIGAWSATLQSRMPPDEFTDLRSDGARWRIETAIALAETELRHLYP